MAWTQFHDMHSGGGNKTAWSHVFVEAAEDEARRIFEERTGRDPDNVTCDCCGADYSVTEAPTLEQATAYERNCLFVPEVNGWAEEPDPRWSRKYIPLADFIARPDILIIRTDQCLAHADCVEHPELGRECKRTAQPSSGGTKP